MRYIPLWINSLWLVWKQIYMAGRTIAQSRLALLAAWFYTQYYLVYIYLPISWYIYFADDISVGCPTARSRLALPPAQWSPSHGNNLDRRLSCEEVFDSDHTLRKSNIQHNTIYKTHKIYQRRTGPTASQFYKYNSSKDGSQTRPRVLRWCVPLY